MARGSIKDVLKERTAGAGAVTIAVVVLVLFMAWQTYVYFGATWHFPTENERFMLAKAEECKGNLRDLNDKDRARLMKMLGPQAGMAISSMYSSAHPKHPR